MKSAEARLQAIGPRHGDAQERFDIRIVGLEAITLGSSRIAELFRSSQARPGGASPAGVRLWAGARYRQ